MSNKRLSNGTLWFIELDGNQIGYITTSGRTAVFPLPLSNSLPQEITAGPDGNLWFTEANGRIGRISTSGAITEFAIQTLEIFPHPRGATGVVEAGFVHPFVPFSVEAHGTEGSLL